MVKTMIAHDVKNFTEWKKGFDADATNRKKMGVKVTGVFRDFNNPNRVIVTANVPNKAAAQAFVSNPELATAMEKAGVVGMPDFRILKKVK